MSFKADPYHFTKSVKGAFKIKALFQRHAAMKRVQRLTQERAQKLQENLKSDDREGLALKEFVTQLKAKRITPEAFFRICDVSYARSVPVDQFKEQMETLNLRLTNTQQQRLMLILDENFTGMITLEEYQDTLEAYELSGERHFVTNIQNRGRYHSMQNKVLEVLYDMMRERDITNEELFSMIDTDDSGYISLSELKSCIQKINPSLMQKEVKAIETYFSQFDVNKNGKIEQDEFISLFDRIQRIVDKKKEMDLAHQNEFDGDDLIQGDQSFINDAFQKVKSVFTGKPSEDSQIKSIVQQMEKEGMSVKLFHSVCLDFQSNSDRIPKAQFLLMFKNAYPKLTVESINLLISKIQLTQTELSLAQMQQLFNKYSTNQNVEADKLLTFVANYMFNLQKSTTQKTDPALVLKECFDRFLRQLNFNNTNELTFANYSNLLKAILKMRETYSKFIFDSIFQQTPQKTALLSEIINRTQMALDSISQIQAQPFNAESLDQKIPGFSKLNSRQQADTAVTFLIKEMKTAKIQSGQVFSVACDPKAESAQNLKLKQSFKKLLKMVDPSLVDAACASFGNDSIMVSRTTFINTFDENFDKNVNKKNVDVKSTRGNSATAVIQIEKKEADSLIKRIDSALQNQGISLQVAFKKADVNRTGSITVHNLKQGLQMLLPGQEITPAEFKMICLAFDVNRNGLIDEQELIETFAKARKQTADVIPSDKQPAKVPIQQIENSNIQIAQNSEEPKNLLVKVILHKAGKSQGYSLPCWQNEQAKVDINQFSDEVCTKQKILSQVQAKLLYQALQHDSQSLYQAALDIIHAKLVTSNQTKQTADNFKLITDMQIAANGLVTIKAASQVFGKIHYTDRKLLNELNDLQRSIGVTQEDLLTFRDFNTAMPILLKSFLVSHNSVPDDEPHTHVNYLAFATGVWLEKPETLYSDVNLESLWQFVVYKYFNVLYSQQLIKYGTNAQEIHNQLLALPALAQSIKLVPKLSVLKWLRLIDQNGLLSLYRNHKCLLARDSRIFLPPLMIKEEARDLFLKNFLNNLNLPYAQQLAKLIQATPIQQKIKPSDTNTSQETKPAKNQANLKTQLRLPGEILFEIEQELQGDISKILLKFVTQVKVPFMQLNRQFELSNIKRPLIEQLCIESNPKGILQDPVDMANLIRYVCKYSKTFNYKESLSLFASKVKEPIRESLLQSLKGQDDGEITKDEFINSFATFEDSQLTKWTMACLFYSLDLEDGAEDECVQFDNLVRLVSQTKGNKQTAPSKQIKPLDKQDQTSKPDAKTNGIKANEPVKDAGKLAPHTQSYQLQALIDYTKELYDKNVQLSQVKQELYLEPTEDDLHVTDVNVIKFCHSLFMLQKKIVAEETLLAVMTKLNNFKDKQQGNNEQAVGKLIFDEINRLMQNLTQAEDINVLVIRISLLQLQENGQCIFDLFELMLASTLLIDRENLNILGTDEEYLNEIVHIQKNQDGTKERFEEFKVEALERLKICLKLSEEVVNQASLCQKQGVCFEITKPKEWQKLRFGKIALALKKQFESAQGSKVKFIDVFKNKDNKLNYFELSQLIKSTIAQTIEVEEWEYEDLMSYLDEFNFANIQFNDIIDWMAEYQFDFGVAKEVNDQENEYKNKINRHPTQYVLGQNDYFRKCPTILNNEASALHLAEKLFKECEAKKTRWFDLDFGPTTNNFESPNYIEESGKSIYFNGHAPQGYPNLNQIVWKSPQAYLNEDNAPILHPQFIVGDASSNEVVQGAIGNCWFIGALSVIATKDELIRGGSNIVDIEDSARVDANVANHLSKGVYPPIFHKYRNQGIYVLRFFKNFKWRYVFIDDRIPVYKGSSSPVFGSCFKPEELWVPLIEKAYAKLFGCYQALASGFIDDGVVDMTGFVCEKRILQDKDGIFTEESEQFWKFLIEKQMDGSLMGCSVSGAGTETKVVIDGVNCGILAGHAYALNDVFSIPNAGKLNTKRNIFRLLRIRNPWGKGEWNGKWSDESQELTIYKNQLEEYIQELDEDERFELGAEDGTFLINYKEWRNIYNRLFIANDFDTEYNAVRFASRWTAETSGGCPLQGTPAQMLSFAKNPQFKITPYRNCELFVSVGQEDGRVRQEDGTYDSFPFTKTMTNLLLFVYELPPGKDRIDTYQVDAQYKLKMEKPIVLSEISTRLNILAGKSYIVMPAVKREGEQVRFIEEENEKQNKVVPDWKKNLIKDETLQYMIKSDDVNSAAVMKARKSVVKRAVKHNMAK